jgi:hypothetical protein
MRIREFDIITGNRLPLQSLRNTKELKYPIINNDRYNLSLKRTKSLNEFSRYVTVP